MKTIFRFFGLVIIIILLISLTNSCKKDNPPTTETVAMTAILQTSAISGGNVTNEGSSPVLSRGVCWNTTSNPTTANSMTSDGSGAGSFTSSLAGLTTNTTYYLKAYAINSAGTSYGNQITFTTMQVTIPVLTTTSASLITQISASSGGNITADNGGSILARGVCWNTSSNPTLSNSKTTNGIGIGTFTSSLTGLVGNTTYYVRAYAINSAGTDYGNQVSFLTSPGVPMLTSAEGTTITGTSAISGGNVTSDGGATVITRGICFATSANPTIANTTVVATGTIGSFTCNLTGLTVNTTYYVRAYATNSAGIVYGNQITFTTLSATIPTVTTTSVTIFTSTSATLGGNVSSDGYATVIERGVYYGTSQNPEITGTKLQISNGAGTFSTSLTSLIPNTSYYIKAYAINIVGTSYGMLVSFTTDPLTVSDYDGNNYNTLRIGTQLWMKMNLKTTKYNNGDLIGTTSLDISSETAPKYQWPCGGIESNVDTYGRLYTWYAVMDSRNVCPSGWHIPTDSDWTTLTTFLGGSLITGGKLKETGTSHWQDPNTGATDEIGFTALPSGLRSSYGSFGFIGTEVFLWSTAEWSILKAYIRTMTYGSPYLYTSPYDKNLGISVRCIKD